MACTVQCTAHNRSVTYQQIQCTQLYPQQTPPTQFQRWWLITHISILMISITARDVSLYLPPCSHPLKWKEQIRPVLYSFYIFLQRALLVLKGWWEKVCELFRARILNLSGHQASIPQNRFLERISAVVELILGRGREDPRTKSIPAFKIINIYGTWMTRFHTWFLLDSRTRFFLS